MALLHDLKPYMEFRNGKPDDMITFSVGYKYNENVKISLIRYSYIQMMVFAIYVKSYLHIIASLRLYKKYRNFFLLVVFSGIKDFWLNY